MAFQVHAADKGFVAAHNDHDEQVGDHHDVNQRQDYQHDERFIERGQRRRGGLGTHAGAQGLQGGLVAKRGLQQVQQLDPEVVDINALRKNEPQVQRQL